MREKELIPIIVKDGIQAVDGRSLHEFLEVKTRYNDWIDRRILEYGFIEGVDFSVLKNEYGNINGLNPYTIDHQLTLDMAKEICMVEKTDRGKEARQYFIAEKVAV